MWDDIIENVIESIFFGLFVLFAVFTAAFGLAAIGLTLAFFIPDSIDGGNPPVWWIFPSYLGFFISLIIARFINPDPIF